MFHGQGLLFLIGGGVRSIDSPSPDEQEKRKRHAAKNEQTLTAYLNLLIKTPPIKKSSREAQISSFFY